MGSITRLVVLLALSLILAACGSSGGSDDSGSDRNQIQVSPEPTPEPDDNIEKPEVLAGVFIDSRVEGLRYVTPTQSGLTNSKGAFNYLANEPIQFYIGSVFIGETWAKPVIIPMDLFGVETAHTDLKVINLVRLLVSLDVDAVPENNLTLPVTVNQLPQGLELDLDQTIESFAQDETVLKILATTESGGELATIQKSFDHFEATLADLGLVDVMQPVLTLDATSRAMVGETVTMSAVVSNISDLNEYTLLWRQISGPEILLSSTNELTTQFKVPSPAKQEHVVVEFLCMDFLGRSWNQTATIKINTPNNVLPSSWAGEDLEVLEGQIVELEGSGSDADGNVTRVGWIQTKGEPVSFSKSTWSNSFRAPEVEEDSELKFRFSVWDNEGAVDGDVVAIKVINVPHSIDIVVNPETVNPESDFIQSNARVNLRANLIVDQADIASITWRQLKGPMVAIYGVNKLNANFTSPIVTLDTELTFELTVVDVNGIPVRNTVSFFVISELFVEVVPGTGNNDFQDTDGDGLLNHIDLDDDNDGVFDLVDAFPFDPAETSDTDADGVGDHADLFPEDSLDWEDFDKDGIGNNSDSDDDDDGLADVDELAQDLDPLNSDTDGDSLNDSIDRFPGDSNNAEIAVEIPGQALNFEASEILLDNNRNALLMIDQAAKRIVVVNQTSKLTERYYSFDWAPQSMVLDAQGGILYVALQGVKANGSDSDTRVTTTNSGHFGLLRHGRIARIDLNSSQKISEFWLPIDPYRMIVSNEGLLLVAGSDGFDNRLLILQPLLEDKSNIDLYFNRSVELDADVRMAFNDNQTRIVIANRIYPFNKVGLGDYVSYWPSQPAGFLSSGNIVTRAGFQVVQGVEAGLFTQISLTEDSVLDATLDAVNNLFFQLISKLDEDGNPVFVVLTHEMVNHTLIEEHALDQPADFLVVGEDSKIFVLSTSAQQSTLLTFDDSGSIVQ